MDMLLEWITKNRDWLFSGAGIVVITLIARFAKDKFHPTAPIAPASSGPHVQPAVATDSRANPAPETKYDRIEMERAYITRRVHVGDYVDFAHKSGRKYRITVRGLDTLDIPASVLNNPKREDVVALAVDLGGGIAYCGTNAKSTGVNEFLVPQLHGDEELRSVFSFMNAREYTSMLRICVEHINSTAGTVDLNIVHIVGMLHQ